MIEAQVHCGLESPGVGFGLHGRGEFVPLDGHQRDQVNFTGIISQKFFELNFILLAMISEIIYCLIFFFSKPASGC